MVQRVVKWLLLWPAGLALLVAHGGLLLVAHTGRGRLFAAAGCAAGIALVLAGSSTAWHRGWARRALCAALAFALLGGGIVASLAPDGRAPAEARVQNRYIGDDWGFRRWAIGNLVPELDQIRLGFHLISRVDPVFDTTQARRLGAWTTAIYDEVEADAEFRALGSAMPHAYAELRGHGTASGHFFLHVPQGLDRARPRPALVFLHGSGGNFKAYTWLLAKVADRVGCVVIAPSFGLGNWRSPESGRVVEAALTSAARVVALDFSQVHLMGLSNGGLGVSQASAEPGASFASLIFLSPVFDHGALASAAFAERWRGREVLVVSGREDDRTPIAGVAAGAARMQAAGARVEFVEFGDADHFLFFSHADAVLARLEAWLAERMSSARTGDAPTGPP
jgi:pimeloyl-ACP methyl ester carboxylesterase